MSKKRLKFDNDEVDKKEFHASKHPIDLDSVLINKIVVSDKFKYSNTGFKYSIDYKDDNIMRPLCIIFNQMSRYIRYFDNRGKNTSFLIEDDNVIMYW